MGPKRVVKRKGSVLARVHIEDGSCDTVLVGVR
jgi:hypothetical protein